jgi:hypothetical protein
MKDAYFSPTTAKTGHVGTGVDNIDLLDIITMKRQLLEKDRLIQAENFSSTKLNFIRKLCRSWYQKKSLKFV